MNFCQMHMLYIFAYIYILQWFLVSNVDDLKILNKHNWLATVYSFISERIYMINDYIQIIDILNTFFFFCYYVLIQFLLSFFYQFAPCFLKVIRHDCILIISNIIYFSLKIFYHYWSFCGCLLCNNIHKRNLDFPIHNSSKNMKILKYQNTNMNNFFSPNLL